MQSRIPNWLPATIALGYAGWGLWTGVPFSTLGLQFALAAGVIALCLWLDLLGGGAVKLMASILIWLTPMQGAVFVFLSYFTCALAGLAIRSMRPDWNEMPYLPFAVLALGAMAAFGGLQFQS